MHPFVATAAAYSWRILVIAGVVVGGLWLIGRLAVVVVPIAVALFVSRILQPVVAWLKGHGWRPGLAALAVMAASAVVIAGAGWLIVPAVVDEFQGLGGTLDEAVNDIEDWIVEDGPIDISRQELQDYEDQALDYAREVVSSSGGGLGGTAGLILEIPAGALLAVFLTFFMLKDGGPFVRWVHRSLPESRRDDAAAFGRSAWRTLGGYLRGAALLGLVEGIVIGGTVWLVGGELVIPIVVLTFAAAFVPIVGAIVAGVVAVLVTLVSAGFAPALIVAGVAIAVQQLDNDLLAPVIYGKNVELHPAIILVSVVAGGALFGFAGTVFAVPVVAVAINAWRDVRGTGAADDAADDAADADTDDVPGTDVAEDARDGPSTAP